MSQSRYNIKKATVLTVVSALSMSVMALFVKLAAPHTTDGTIIFFRFGVSLLYLICIISIRCMRGHAFPARSKNPKLQIFRAISGMLGMLFFYHALAFIPLVDGNLLVMTNALFVPILTFIIFRYRTNLKSWTLIIIGFIGVALVLKPGQELFNTASLFALAAGLCAAISLLVLRESTRYDDAYTNMLYYFTVAFIASGLISLPHWQLPDGHTIFLLLLVGFFASVYQECLIRASCYAPARIVTSLMYVSVVSSGILGWVIFHETPSYLTWVGITLVCCSSILTVKSQTNHTNCGRDMCHSGKCAAFIRNPGISIASWIPRSSRGMTK